MNVARMRFIDKWLGMPVCLLLTLWRRVVGVFGRTPGVDYQPRLSFNPYLNTGQIFQIMVDALDQPAAALPTYPQMPPAESASIRFEPDAEEIAEVRSIVREHLGNRRPMRLILLNANASDLISGRPPRRWPVLAWGRCRAMVWTSGGAPAGPGRWPRPDAAPTSRRPGRS